MANKFPLILNTSANQIQEIASGDNLDLTGCKIVGLDGINSAGIVTFTKAHVGAATTWGEDLVVTGNARVTGILTVGTNSVTINGNDVNITGVTTASNFKTGTSNLHNVGLEIAGINVLGADTPIGTGATIYNSGAAVFTGIVTAANYVGTINTPAQPNITSVGTLSSLNVSGNVSIGGTLTYEDVTNIDAVGLITARNGINVSGGNAIVAGMLDVDGHTNLDNVSVAGVTTFSGNAILNGTTTFGDDVTFTGASSNILWDKSANTLLLQDSAFLNIGTGNDLQLYHNPSNNHSYISEQGSGSLIILADDLYIQDTSTNSMIQCIEGAQVQLHYAGNKKLETTSSGVNFTGTDYGFGATPGGNPAAKNVFLAIGDSDTGIVQDGDGQLELWANAVEVANINAIDGYTSTKPITTTGNVSVGDFTAKSALFTDNGTASPVVELRTDDAAPWALQIANDTYSNAGHGLHFNVENGGEANIRNIGASSYNDIKIGVVNGGSYHQTLTIDETGIAVLGASGVTAGRLTLNDNGSSSPLLRIKTDDGSPYAMIVGNDTYNTGNFGLHQYQENGGNYFIRLVTNSEYKNLYIQTSNNSTHSTGIYIDSNRSVGLNYQGTSRLYTADASSTGIGCVVENGSLEVKHTNDWQLRVYGTDGWAGIQFKDNNNSDQIWYNGGNSTFTIGGGGSNVAGKKLHIDGGTTIGATIDTHTPPTNGLKVQGPLNVGSGSADNDMSKFTNGDSGNHEYTHLGNNTRLLHSNGTGWDGHTHSDGCDPIIICSSGDRAGNSDRGDSAGLVLHTNSDDDNDYSPLIGFSARSNSGSYNSIHAAIMAKKKGQAADHNWNAGQLEFYTAGKESNRASDQYMDNIPDFFINRRGYTGTPRHPRFQAYKSGSNWSVNGNADLVWDNTVYNIGNCYNTGNGRFTAPCDGFYYFTVYSITYGQYTNAAWYVRINNNRVNGGDTHFSTHGTNWEHVGWSGVYKLTAGQYVSVQTNVTVTYHGGSWSGFSGYLVSSESW